MVYFSPVGFDVLLTFRASPFVCSNAGLNARNVSYTKPHRRKTQLKTYHINPIYLCTCLAYVSFDILMQNYYVQFFKGDPEKVSNYGKCWEKTGNKSANGKHMIKPTMRFKSPWMLYANRKQKQT